LASTAAAQQPALPDTSYYITYYGNANTAGFPDAQVTIVNPGSTGGWSITDGQSGTGVGGDLCANIYVFTSDQEMVECCSCAISPNGMLQFSLNTNLTANPLANSQVVPLPVAGALKVVSSRGPGCSSGSFASAAATYTPDGSLRGWNTHVRATVPGAPTLWTVTETPLRMAYLDGETAGGSITTTGSPALTYEGPATVAGSTELGKLQAECYALQDLGSGRGRCTCPTTSSSGGN
jgi:hypothetical protein